MKVNKSSREQKGAIIGTLLGDSWISNRGEFGCQHVTKDLIDLKATIISNISPEIRIYFSTRKPRTSIKKNMSKIQSKTSYVLQTNKHPYFKKLRNILYIDNQKQISMKVLNKLTPFGIALWFMDDGYLDYKKSSNTRNLRLCTDNFDITSHKNMIRYFNDVWGIQAKIYYHKSRKNEEKKPRLSFNAHNSQKLIVLIHKYFLPSFLYKLDLKYSDKTLNSIRCSQEYKEAHKYILQHIT